MLRRHLMPLLAVLAAAGGGATAALAAGGAHHATGLSAFRAAGLSVRWPLPAAPAVRAEGTALSVGLRPRPGRHPGVAVVTLVRTDAPRARLATRRLRAGSTTIDLPASSGVHYELRLQLGRLRYATQVRTAPATTGGEPGPTTTDPGLTSTTATGPAGTPPPCPQDGTHMATMSLDRTTVHAGDSVSYTVTNTGTACLTMGAAHDWSQRQADGSYAAIQAQPPEAVPEYAVQVPPGKSFTTTAHVGTNFAPGHYRLMASFDAGTAQAELDVAAG